MTILDRLGLGIYIWGLAEPVQYQFELVILMATETTPIKEAIVNIEDMISLKEETSTTCHSDADHEDLSLTKQETYYYQEQPQQAAQLQQMRNHNHKLKNELCRNFLRTGFCPYNDKCQFAHGTAELRQNLDHNAKYKTKKCIAFFRDCFCIYGERCNFLHSQPAQKQEAKWRVINKNYRQLLAETRQSSRLFPVGKALPN